ncbi:MAG: hypothetical protein IEMM0001_2071 [bacterium]|nr:MAG: hypothetical protein IEMM0001_2071 [bacterium]
MTYRLCKVPVLVLMVLAMFLTLNMPKAAAAIDDGLIAYYLFDGNALDASGNDNNGTEYGGLKYKQGINGESATFDGIDDYIRIPSAPLLNPVDQLSISFWVKVEGFTNTWSPIIHKGGPVLPGYSNREYTVWLQNTSNFLLSSAGDNSSQYYKFACCANPNHWTHYVGIIDRQTYRMKVYVDGVLKVDANDPYSTFNNNSEDLLIGWTEEVNSSYSPFKGRIDELRIYNRALTEDEVRELYEEFPTPPVIYFNDFNADVGAEWSSTSIATTPAGNRSFLGVFSNNNVQLTLPPYTEGEVTINFDLFVLRSWDGNDYYWVGPDYFTLQGDGQNLLHTTFSNGFGGSQSYPGNYRKIYPGRWGAVENNTLGYGTGGWGDSVYTITKNFHHLSGNILVNFVGSHLQGWSDEGWGLDNVRIYFQPANESSPGIVGNTIKTQASYEFTIEQSGQKEFPIQLTNTGNDTQSLTVEVINPHLQLTVSTTQQTPVTLAPGDAQDIQLSVNAGSMPVGVYDNLLLKLTVENGETIYSNIKVTVVEQGAGDLPDLSINSQGIHLSDYTLGESATLQAVIRNKGQSPASNVQVQFYEFGSLLGEVVLDEVPAGGVGTALITVPISTSGEHLIRVVVDSSGTIDELDENNNEASQMIKLGSPAPVPGSILVTGSLPSTVYTGALFNISGRAVYDVYVDGVRYTNYVVKGGSVQITIKDDAGNEWVYGDVHTTINGNFAKTVQAPATTGTYQISITVTDETVSGKRDLLFSVTERPPQPPLPPPGYGSGSWTYVPASSSSPAKWTWVWTNPPVNAPVSETDLRVFSENIHFSRFNPDPDEEITIFAEIKYWATSTDLVAQNVPVNFYVTYPGTPKMKIGETVINRLSVGFPDYGSRYVYTSWKSREEGFHIVEVEIDPGYVEKNKLNNAATRAIIVGQLQSQQGAIAGQVTNPWGGVSNIMIELYNSSGTTLLENKLTDDTGYYLFENVPVDDYQVHIVNPEDYEVDAETKYAEVTDRVVTEVDFHLIRQKQPVADAGGPYTGSVGVPVMLDASGSYDPDGQIVTYQWDCDNDGTYEQTTLFPTLKYTWSDAYDGIIGLLVTDNDGLSATDTTTVEITVAGQGQGLCGDLDGDGDVDGDDRNILRLSLDTRTGDAGFVPEADYDGDGLISYNDYREWYVCYKAYIAP